MLVQLGELPVYWVDVHVVVLLKVLRQQFHRVVTGVQTSLALKDFLHLRSREEGTFLAFVHRIWGGEGCGHAWSVLLSDAAWA